MNKQRKEIAAYLNRARHERGMTFRGLAGDAGMKHSYLGLIQRGERGVGPNVAARLATALHLSGSERQRFIDLAARTSGSKTKSAELTNVQQILGHVLAGYLRMQKIEPRNLRLGCIEVGVPFGGVARQLWTACVRGTKPGPLKDSVQQNLRESKRAVLLVVFLPGNKQAVLDAGFTCFSD